jgi:hypothetical protein
MNFKGDVVKFWKYKDITFLVITNDGKTILTVPIDEKLVPDFVKNNIHFENGCDFVLSNVESVRFKFILDMDIIANGENDPDRFEHVVMIHGRSNNKN